jgi:hypothetical protein
MLRMFLHVVGDSQFVATLGDVNLGPAGDVQLGTFSAVGVNVTLQEDDSTQLLTIDATGDLRVTSVSTVTDNPRASIAVAGDATIVGTAITLADNATETLSCRWTRDVHCQCGRCLDCRALEQ